MTLHSAARPAASLNLYVAHSTSCQQLRVMFLSFPLIKSYYCYVRLTFRTATLHLILIINFKLVHRCSTDNLTRILSLFYYFSITQTQTQATTHAIRYYTYSHSKFQDSSVSMTHFLYINPGTNIKSVSKSHFPLKPQFLCEIKVGH